MEGEYYDLYKMVFLFQFEYSATTLNTIILYLVWLSTLVTQRLLLQSLKGEIP